MRSPILPSLLVLCAGSAAALAQSVTVTRLYREQDAVSTPTGDFIGLATSFNGVAVNDAGVDLVEFDTDHADTNADVVVLRDGVLFARENDPVGVGSVAVSSFDSININAAGNVAWNNFFRNATTNTDSGIRFNNTLVLQEGTASTSPAFTPGTPYVGFFEVRGDDDNDFLVVASVDDPAIPTTVDRALVVFDYNPSTNTYTETVLWKEGDVLPGMTAAVSDFGTGPENISRSPNGQYTMFTVTSVGGATDSIYLNSTLIAQELQPSPIAGRNFRILTSQPVSVNNTGQYAFRATLDGDAGSDSVIFRGAEVIAQEGGEVPGVPGFQFTSFGTGPIFVDSAGGVTWFGDWNDPDTTRDRGLFRDQQLILREGDVVDGETITNILGVSEGYNQSPDGRYVIVKVTLGTNVDAVLLLTVGGGCDSIDFNGDGLFPDNTDLEDFLSVFGGGPCSTGTCGDIDFNNDGLFPDNTDLEAFFSVFGGGPC